MTAQREPAHRLLAEGPGPTRGLDALTTQKGTTNAVDHPLPTLEIQPGTPIGKFQAIVKWSVSWDSYDQASGQPYTADVKVFGYDQGVAPSPQHLTSKTYTIKPGDALPRKDTFTVDYGFLDEDLGQDEIRASVMLTPIAPKIAGPTSSDEIVLNL